GRRSGPAVMSAMPHALRRINDVALVREKDWQRTDLVFDLAFQDEPEFARHLMEMALVFRIVSLWIPPNDIRERAIVINEGAGWILSLGNHAVEIEERFVFPV